MHAVQTSNVIEFEQQMPTAAQTYSILAILDINVQTDMLIRIFVPFRFGRRQSIQTIPTRPSFSLAKLAVSTVTNATMHPGATRSSAVPLGAWPVTPSCSPLFF